MRVVFVGGPGNPLDRLVDGGGIMSPGNDLLAGQPFLGLPNTVLLTLMSRNRYVSVCFAVRADAGFRL